MAEKLPVIEMPYIGAVLSVNRYKHHGTTRTRKEVKDWMFELALQLSHKQVLPGVDVWTLRGPRLIAPLTCTVSARFRDRRRPDLHNLFKVIADAVEMGTWINDRDIEMREGEVSYDKNMLPVLWIEVREK